jgi:SAM-dependent methyltransferase
MVTYPPSTTRGKEFERAKPPSPDVFSSPGCIACGCTLTRPLFTVGGYRYVTCPACQLAHLNPVPNAEALRSVFSDAYFTGGVAGGYDDYERDEPLHRRNAHVRIERVAHFTSPPGRWLDVGCAHGYVIDAAREVGWSVEGVEVSPTLVQRLRARGEIVKDDLAAVAREQPHAFDVVSLFQVLDHVAAPDEFLLDAVRCLRVGGTLVVETWDRRSLFARLLGGSWPVIAPPSVPWLYTRGSVEMLLERTGAMTLWFEPVAKWVSLGLVASLLDAPNRPPILASTGRALRQLPPSLGLPYMLGDLVTVVARRIR